MSGKMNWKRVHEEDRDRRNSPVDSRPLGPQRISGCLVIYAKWTGGCAGCGEQIALRARCWWNPETKVIRCLDCRPKE
jgi:hypothetical protein